jgi:hypothetical protein|tara:strand:+ start:28 stop:219 length:192 start_codon:yes stop_codon:yes gene_type:complete
MMTDKDMRKVHNILLDCRQLIEEDKLKDQNDLDDMNSRMGTAIGIIEQALNVPEDFWKVGGTI